MAALNTLVILIPFFLLALHLAQSNDLLNIQEIADHPLSDDPSPPPIDCGNACEVRCALASRHKVCLRACGTCCERCHCVPPGTSGNYDACPCYANMTTHDGRRKCP
ncbi:SN2 [Linum perenne]